MYKSYSEGSRLLHRDSSSNYSATDLSPPPHVCSAPSRIARNSVASNDSGHGCSAEGDDSTLGVDDEDFIDLSPDCEEPKTPTFLNQNDPVA